MADMADMAGGAAPVDLVAHVHLADTPGRHEPGTGTIDWRRCLGELRRWNYVGALGLEYRPLGDTVASLRSLRRTLAGR